jgi:hypothetical protein
MSGVRVGMGVTGVSMEVDVGLGMRDGRGGLDGCDGYDWYGWGKRRESVGCERHFDGIDHANDVRETMQNSKGGRCRRRCPPGPIELRSKERERERNDG